MKLRLRGSHRDEVRAFCGWLELNLIRRSPVLRVLEVTYDDFEDGAPMSAEVHLEFADRTVDNE